MATDGVPPGDTTDPATAADPVGSASPISRNLVTEAIGTFVVMVLGPGLLVFAGGRVDDVAVAIGFGAGIAIAIGVIGAVANPAFTLALLIVREITGREAVGDWFGQLIGAVLGGAVIWGIDDRRSTAGASNGWDRDGFSSLGSVIAAELVVGLIVVVVLLGAISRGLSEPAVAGFAGLAVGAGALVLLPIDGVGLNPARSIGSALFSDADPNALGQLWPFVVVPLAAGLGAVFVWLAIDDAELDDTVFDETVLDDLQNIVTGDHD